MTSASTKLCTLTLGIAATSSWVSAADGPISAGQRVAEFQEVCLSTRFDAGRVEEVMRRREWKLEKISQVQLKYAEGTTWKTDFGQVAVGSFTVGGVNLKKQECSFVFVAPNAPTSDQLASAFDSSVRFSRRSAGSQLEHREIDTPDEQSLISIVGDQVPVAANGTVSLQPGVLLAYRYAKGPKAKELMER